MIRRIAIVAVCLALSWAFLPAFGAKQRVRVLAASSVAPLVEEAATLFRPEGYDVRVVVEHGPSGLLLEQLLEGEQADLFIGASPEELNRLDQAGRLLDKSRREFASADLVIIVPRGRAVPWIIQDLMRPEFDIIALPHPDSSPVGANAKAALEKIGVLDALAPRIVRVEDPLRLARHVADGDVAAGIVYGSTARQFADRVTVGPSLPADSHPRVRFQGAVLEPATEPELALAFLEYFMSIEGKELAQAHGLLQANP